MEKYCTLLQLLSSNHNIEIIVPVLLEEQLMVLTTTTDTKDIYKIASVVTANINYPVLSYTSPDLVERMQLGRDKI